MDATDVAKLLRAADKPLTTSQIAAKLKKTEVWVRHQLHELRSQGLLRSAKTVIKTLDDQTMTTRGYLLKEKTHAE